MCGICGIYNMQSGEPVSGELVEQMSKLVAHRGPDDQGIYLDGNLGLGFTRLSIIDLSGGHQPMCNETEEIWVVFNGEIWNFKTLRQELLEKGHHFRTNSDTETIVHAYEEYGVDCIERLHGMFGLAIWDQPRKRLLLARDRVGKKPLYYTCVDGNLVFGSEIKSLLRHPRVKRQADVQALADFLSVRYVPGPATLFANIYKVLPGHWLLCENGAIREECYWDFTFGETEKRPLEEYLQGIQQHITRAVQERMMADVPLGAMLSGGIDSSIITGIMSQLSDKPVKTFSVGFDVPGFNELPYARLVSEYFGTEHHELVVQGSDLTEYWPLLTWYRDEPVSEPSDLGVYLISKLARQHVKVVLSGEGADELFAGYPKYIIDWIAKYYHLLPAAMRDGFITPLLGRLPYNLRKLKMAGRVLSEPAPQRWMSWFGVFNGQLKNDLLSEKTKASIDNDASRAFQRWLERNPQRDNLSSMLYLDTKIWLPDNLLMKGDKMTMAASLESRLPLLDYKLIEYAASIPSAMKVKLFQAKYLLKRAYADFLPRPILTRKKMGFNVPNGIWFREGQRHIITQLLLSERTHSRGFLNHECVATLLRDHLEGRTQYPNQLFILASLELWFRVFIDKPELTYPQTSLEEFLDDKPVAWGLAPTLGDAMITVKPSGNRISQVTHRPLRVLIVTGVYPTERLPHKGTFVKSQADSLIAAGVEVEILHSKPGPVLLRYFWTIAQVWLKTRTKQFDIVNGHYGQWCLFARLQWHVPVVATFHGSDLLGVPLDDGKYSKLHALNAHVNRWLCSRVDAVIVQSEEMKRATKRGYVYVIPTGVDFELFRPIPRAEARAALSWDQDRYYVLFGNNPAIPLKGFKLGQTAVERLQAKGMPIELVVANGLPQTKLVQCINASNALILPSLCEGSPCVVKEAMACNIPVVATAVGDVAEVIGQTRGCSVCSQDPEELAAGIERALQHEGPTSGRGDISHLECSVIAERVIGVYESVLKMRGVAGQGRAAAPTGEEIL